MPPSSPARPAAPPSIDTVLFAMNALVDPVVPQPDTAPTAAPGVRRLLAAATRAGMSPRALATRETTHSTRAAHLAACADHLAAAGLGPELPVVDADAAVPRTRRDRTLVVTRCPEMAAGLAGASHPVVVIEDRPVALAVHDALAAEVGAYDAARLLVGPLDDDAADDAAARHLRLTKPPGSLGQLEAIGAHLAAVSGTSPPPLPRPAATAVFAGDHGGHGQGVSPWPQEVTGQMVANFLAGGAAVNVIAAQAGADVVVVDVGVAGDIPGDVAAGHPDGATGPPVLLRRRVRAGTADLATGPAMSRDEAQRALDIGAEVAARLVAGGARCLITGDMGIANTTAAATLIASVSDRPAAAVTGRGTGIDDDVLTRKTALVAAASARARYLHDADALGLLAEVGGLEHAALAGFIVAGAALQVPVIVDGVNAGAALLVASRLAPGVERCVIAGHRSAEPGASAVIDALGLTPLLDLDLRLGEGTGALLALPMVEAAARVLHEMATFDQAGVADKG
jgi:nicotinate-nucleotide--dimethylbenzimidazole phosphoribosyltransferase